MAHIFEVAMPNGEIIEVEAPAETSHDAIRQRVTQHFIQSTAPKPPIPAELQQQPTGDSFLADAIGGVGPSRFGERILGGIASMANTLLPAGDTPRPNTVLPMTPEQEIGAKGITAANIGMGVASLGQFGKARLLRAPEMLMLKAGTFRAAEPVLGGRTGAGITGAVGRAVEMPIRRTAARGMEYVALKLPQGRYVDMLPPTPEGVVSPIPVEPATPAIGRSFSAQRLAAREAPPLSAEGPRGVYPGSVEQPSAQQFPRPAPAELPPDLSLPPEARLTKPSIESRAEVPFNPPESFAQPLVQPSSFLEQTAKDAVQPRGKFDSQWIDRNANRLLEAAPEIRGKTRINGFDKALVTAHERVAANVDAVDALVPDSVTVPKSYIIDKLSSLAAGYEEDGLPQVASKIRKVESGWADMPEKIPWSQFRAAKRAFFKEYKTSSTPMRRAYGVLMDASSEFSGVDALKQANQDYSTVRKALDAAQIDPVTGTRWYEVIKSSPQIKVEKVKRLRGS